MSLFFVWLFGLAEMSAHAQTNSLQSVIKTAEEFHRLSTDPSITEQRFELEGLVTFVNAKQRFIIADKTGSVAIDSKKGPSVVKTGDVVRVCGTIGLTSTKEHRAVWDSIRRLGHGNIPQTIEANELMMRNGALNYQLIHAHGIIADAFKDEIDSRTNIFVLRVNSDTMVISLVDNNFREELFSSFIGAEADIKGICIPLPGYRQYMPPYIEVSDVADITITASPTENLFRVPPLEDVDCAPPDLFSKAGRRRLSGIVMATWSGTEMLVHSENGHRLRVSLGRSQKLPPVFESVDVIGFPDVDNFSVTLKKCICVPHGRATAEAKPPISVSGTKLMTGRMGKREINSQIQSKLVKISGTITSAPSPNDRPCRLGLESDGFTIPIDISSNPDILNLVSIGCRTEVAGVCILQPTQWTSNDPFQRIRDIFIVPRSAQDVRILSRPPWLTVQRLLIIVGSLLAVIIGIFIRNRILKRIIERRSRELLREEVAHARADLKVEERTRLAVELHDTLSQNITGVALQIDAAQTAAEKDPASVLPYLEVTQRKMQNCRENLRNCLWDLRSRAFEEENLGDAIRKTIAHHLGKSQGAIDCDIPCRGLSDNTIHAILCIIRELTVNAIRHGNAAQISISGKQTDGRLSFVVRDDGCGFDPAMRPGMSEGHFGLQGIDERIRRLDGTWRIDSNPGDGCTVTVDNLLANS